jgi:TetR/AcrR family transcriptional regulator, regulator of cefoperazone and chloramphenicol sensitivity
VARLATVTAVPRSADETRRLLLDAAEARFAADGIRGATFADIIADAGQRNNSAIQYHFGDRMGLLEAVTARRVAQLAAHRNALVDGLPADASVRDLVEVIVAPLAAMLDDRGGAAYLQIQAELLAEPARDRMPVMLSEPWARPGLERVGALLVDRLPLATGPETTIRALLATTLIFHALADRARATQPGTDHGPFVNGLISATVAVLETRSADQEQ